MEKVSIIIITLNEEKYLPRLLDSLKQQTYNDFEIIVSDSNSNDKTINVAKEYSKDFKEFKIKQLGVAKGPAYGRNQGVKLAKYENLLFLDADTILKKDFLERMIKIKNKRHIDCASFYYGNYIGRKPLIKILWAIINFFMFLIQATKKPAATGAFVYSTKEIYNKLKGFNETISYAEDTDYARKSLRLGKYRMIQLKPHYDPRRFEKKGIINYFIETAGYNIKQLFNEIKFTKSNCNYKIGLNYKN